MKKLVYIAGPFGSSPVRNTKLAMYLALFAKELGYAAYVPHILIQSGIYGNDDDTEERANGLRIVLSFLKWMVLHPSSELWVIEQEDGTLSDGTQREYNLWVGHRGILGIRRFTFLEWKDRVHEYYTAGEIVWERAA